MKKIRGFTLLEILLVVAAIAILAGIVIVAINPAKQLADTRNAQRRSDINAISSAIAQFSIKNGDRPSDMVEGDECTAEAFDSSDVGICATGLDCGGIRLDNYLVPDFLPSVPIDPAGPSDDFSGYTAVQLSNKRIQVCAPFAENDEVISVTR